MKIINKYSMLLYIHKVVLPIDGCPQKQLKNNRLVCEARAVIFYVISCKQD